MAVRGIVALSLTLLADIFCHIAEAQVTQGTPKIFAYDGSDMYVTATVTSGTKIFEVASTNTGSWTFPSTFKMRAFYQRTLAGWVTGEIPCNAQKCTLASDLDSQATKLLLKFGVNQGSGSSYTDGDLTLEGGDDGNARNIAKLANVTLATSGNNPCDVSDVVLDEGVADKVRINMKVTCKTQVGTGDDLILDFLANGKGFPSSGDFAVYFSESEITASTDVSSSNTDVKKADTVTAAASLADSYVHTLKAQSSASAIVAANKATHVCVEIKKPAATTATIPYATTIFASSESGGSLTNYRGASWSGTPEAPSGNTTDTASRFASMLSLPIFFTAALFQ